jgi:plasmid stabilization system protein ParE
VASRISASFDLLDAKPQIGRPAPDGRNREWSVPGLPHFIVYRVRGFEVTILRVFHTSRLRPNDWN